MKFFFPDSQDLVDPSFDFETEERSRSRERHRDDLYAHEVFAPPPFDGLLVSKGIVDAYGGNTSRYTISQRLRLLREGAREFFRIPERSSLPIMGDCGAFTYVREDVPPWSAADVAHFYEECRFDLGISVDHVILAFDSAWDALLPGLEAPPEFQRRQAITLGLAAEFIRLRQAEGLRFEPVGVAQGWSPRSYAKAVRDLQAMGYEYIAVGGLVPLKTKDILSCLQTIAEVRRPETRLHLLGVTRTDHIEKFADHGVVSFDSTSPLRQAFKDDKDNYYSPSGPYSAIRIPQVEGNPKLQKRIRAGLVSQDAARRLEQACMKTFEQFEKNQVSRESLLDVLEEYGALCDPGQDRRSAYATTLEASPWRNCGCEVCRQIGHHVILFRGAERNRRRGFHNLWVFYNSHLPRPLHAEAGVAPRGPQERTLQRTLQK